MISEVKNYITPAGYRRLQEELGQLWKVERPTVVATVAWAASNGDRSENGDYIYGKRRLREIDRRIRYLSKSLDRAVVVDNSGKNHDRVFFGATVTIANEAGDERDVTSVVALSPGEGAAQGKGWRHRDTARAAWRRAPRDRGNSLRGPAMSGLCRFRHFNGTLD
jgi:transcription elongation factor GreB